MPVIHRRYEGLIHGFLDLAALSPRAAEAVREVCADLRVLLERRGAGVEAESASAS
ncbi:MAG TPA: hypothetical protein VFQ12_10275 [Thermoleophilaceae bacterium]|nr:hypothetical protein [Thermoleophilaceae bacterium]